MRVIGAVAYGILVPGMITILMPWLMLRHTHRIAEMQPWIRYVGWIPVVLGMAMIGLCVRDLLVRGLGTPAPTSPPRHLVRDGLYRVTRNPMYCGILLMLLGEALVFWSNAIVLAAGATWMCMELFLRLIEERGLRRRFGSAYDLYTRDVPRWFPTPWFRRRLPP